MPFVNGVQIGEKLSVNFMTNMQKLHRGIWPWTVGLKARLPLHYKLRYIEKFMRDPEPVHYRFDSRKYVADQHGQPVRVLNVPIPVLFPKEADYGLWGGDGIVAGFKKRKNDPLKPRAAAIWKPYLTKRVFYSEILDRWMSITVTRRTLDLIDTALGFDNYILSTAEIDMHSRLGMKLKQEMLLALANKAVFPNDPARCEAILKKYEKFIIPAEEAEWVGLTLYEAERKQHEIEEADRLSKQRPLKEVFTAELVQKLQQQMLEESSSAPAAKSWLRKLNPFQEKNAD